MIELINKVKKSNLDYDTKEVLVLELEQLHLWYQMRSELMKRGRNGNYLLIEDYKGWKIGYPYPAHGYTAFMMWKNGYSVHCIVGERLAQGNQMPLWIEPDCCCKSEFDLDELIEHLETCKNLKKEPNWEKRD